MTKKTKSAGKASPEAVTVRELVEGLLTRFDPDMPVYKHNSGGEFIPLTPEALESLVEARELMRRTGSDYDFTALSKDEIWQKQRGEFGPDFKSVVIW